MFQKVVLLFLVLCCSCFIFAQEFNPNNLNQETLNKAILVELNKLRKTQKCADLFTNNSLLPAAEFHTAYMIRKNRLTHNERFNRKMKYPKNRVDFFAGKFKNIGENVQLNNLQKKGNQKPISTYQELALELVSTWKSSKPHLKNILSPLFLNTFTYTKILENGTIFSCQLFGDALFKAPYPSLDSSYYKPFKPFLFNTKLSKTNGFVYLLKDSSIVFETFYPRWRTSLVFKNPFRSGMAADIIVKSQFPCDSANFFNPETAVSGISLPPVYKKDFEKHNLFQTQVILGKLPFEIDQEFDINLTLIKGKRSWKNVMFEMVPSKFNLIIPVEFEFDSLQKMVKNKISYPLFCKSFFEKSAITPMDSSYVNLLKDIKGKENRIKSILVKGFASIEGSAETNLYLYEKRADFLKKLLIQQGIDSTIIKISVSENFEAFRQDIQNTIFERFDTLSNDKLRNLVTENQSKFEFLLKNHRYIECNLEISFDSISPYTATNLMEDLMEAEKKKNYSQIKTLQPVAFQFLKDGSLSWSSYSMIKLPSISKTDDIVINNGIMEFLLKSDSFQSNIDQQNALQSLKENLKKIVNKESTEYQTTLAIIEFNLGSYFIETKKNYLLIKKNPNIQSKIKSRILLNLAYRHDLSVKRKNDLLNVKSRVHIRSADLSTQEYFDIAGYQLYFKDPTFAYSLVKSKISTTDNYNNMLFYLKLVTFCDPNINENERLRAYKRAAKAFPEKFCKSFNYYGINMQVLKDEKVKEIYCETCNK